MAVTDTFDELSEKVDEAKRSIEAAASEGEAEVKAKVDEARTNADAHATELGTRAQATADHAVAHWQQIQSDWEQHRQNVRQWIDEAKEEQDLEAAVLRAQWAEADAADAVDFAANAIDEAKYAVLNSILAAKDVAAHARGSS